MKRSLTLLAAVLLLVVGVSSFAQSGATGTTRAAATVDVTIATNPRGAQVTIDKVTRVSPAVFKLAAGTYNMTLQLANFQSQTVVLTIDASKGSAQTFTFNMVPATFRLTVRPNVREATLTLNRELQKGTMPWSQVLPQGTYALVVSAKGYIDFTQTVQLDRDTVVDVLLQPALFRLSVQAAVKDAVVTVNKVAKGALPYQEQLPGGTYEILVTARGYLDFVQTIVLERDTVVTADLKAAVATLVMPEKYLEGNVQHIKLYIDGKLVNPQLAVKGILEVPAGKHLVRIATAPAGLAVEGEFTFEAGVRYEVRPTLLFLTEAEVKAEGARR